jgi:hypothetical protein
MPLNLSIFQPRPLASETHMKLLRGLDIKEPGLKRCERKGHHASHQKIHQENPVQQKEKSLHG